MSQTQSTVDVSQILEPLTAAQREAVQCVDGPLLILAGPGSGKTRVITHRIAYLLHQGIRARNILALTFTNKAADEMRQRLEKLAPRESVWVGTFHRFCARLLRQHAELVGLKENYSIYDAQDSLRALKQTLEDAGIDLTHTTPETVANAISWAKNEVLPPEKYTARIGNVVGGFVERAYPEYQKQLLGSNAVDFDDLLMHVALLLQENAELRQSLDERYQFIMVDEYQDTNLAQYTIARALSQSFPNLAVAGDPDQSIYGWRGANLNNILDFENDYDVVRTVRLEQNWRSTPNILRVADQLISYNVRRKKKSLYTDRPEGKPARLVLYPTSREEADGIAERIVEEVEAGRRRLRDFAIFYRVNALSRYLENALRAHNIPYQIVRGLEFYQRKEIKDILAYLHLINNPDNDVALRRIINTPARKIGKKTIERLSEHAQRTGKSMLEAAHECDTIDTLTRQAKSAVRKFVAMYDGLRASATDSLTKIIKQVLDETGYHDWLFYSDVDEDRERLDNIEELVSDAQEFDELNEEEGTLQQFLEERTLISDTDDWDEQIDRVTMMTLHAAKGLEFPVVFIVAVEQGLLPHERSSDDADGEEEERRLMFVGITRAEDELQLSVAQYRSFRGRSKTTIPSPFLMELPREEMEMIEPMRFAVRHTESWSDDKWEDEFADDYSQVDPDEVDFNDIAATDDAPTEQPPVRRYPPHLFKHGVSVEHPQYGSGMVVSVSGTGRNRSATIQFDDGLLRTFRLSHAPLTPIPVD